MVKQMIVHTIKEYRGRFLHELIQNGYDAHPEGTRGGRLAIHFHESDGSGNATGENRHGVLYVANGGQPLSASNFERMASLGESDKPIGVGIGNKGVGFKSVFQICAVPEVYSALDADDPGFNGFSFRFGTHTDLVSLLNNDEARAAQVADKLSLSMLTMPLDAIPPEVQALREQGYVTVLRLPAIDARAAREIKERIDRLLTPSIPIMLFLERIEKLSIQTTSSEKPTVLTRRVLDAAPTEAAGHPERLSADPPAALPYDRVVLDGQHTFRLFTKAVVPARLQAALRESVEEGALDERWLTWDSPAHVSVAVGDNTSVSDGHAYTYLPMGDDATSPIAGHINAPFITDFARVGLNREQPVNKLLLTSLAELCLEAAGVITASDGDADTVTDLLAWREAVDILEQVSTQTCGQPLFDVVRVPDLRGRWTPLSTARVWRWPDTVVVTGGSITADSNAAIVDAQRISADRQVRLASFAKQIGVSVEPSPTELADWVEAQASAMVRRGEPVEVWPMFYDDLSTIFALGAKELAGRRILLSTDGTLADCNTAPDPSATGARRRRRRSVFFSPQAASGSGSPDARDDTSDDTLVALNAKTGAAMLDFRPPRSLRERIVFMHSDIDWYQGPSRRPGRDFLENARLVQAFRTERLLPLLGQVMETVTSDSSKRDALGFAFRLFAGDTERHARELLSVGLQVPTQSGEWIRASQARFGHPWPVTCATELSILANAASAMTPDLSALKALLVAAPSEFVAISPVDDAQRWRDFLTVLGVKTSLPILETSDGRAFNGRYLSATTLSESNPPSAIPAGVLEQWALGIGDIANSNHPDTRFTTTDAVYWLMGQHEIGLLPRRQRAAYAQAVVRTLSTIKPQHLSSTWRRNAKGGVDSNVPTPLAAFLRHSDWVPNGRHDESWEFLSPMQSWYVTVENQVAAAYSPLVASPVRQAIDRLPNARLALTQIQMQVWGDPADAADLVDHLTVLFEAGEVAETSSDHFRSTLARAWEQLGRPTAKFRPTVENGLLVERAGRIEFLAPASASDERVFVVSNSDQSATTRLVRELGSPVLNVETVDVERLREIADTVLRPHWNQNAEVATDWTLEVLADGTAWEAAETDERLCAEIPWLSLVLACTMRFPRSGPRIGRNLESVMDDLARIRLVRCGEIRVATANTQEPLPARLHGVLPLAGTPATLLVQQLATPLTWEQLEKVAEAALELLGQTRFTAELSLNLSKIASGPGATIFRPDIAEIAEILGVPEHLVSETEGLVYGSTAGVLTRLQPIAVAMWGPDALAELHPEIVTTRDALASALEGLCSSHAAAYDLMAKAVDCASADALRRQLGIDLVTFNQTLAEHFPASRPIDNSVAQLEEFNLRRSQRRGEILDWIRHSRLPSFTAKHPQTDWPAIRTLTFLRPDPSWGTTYDEVGETRIDIWINQQLTDQFGVPPAQSTLTSASDLRESTSRTLRERLLALERLITAWSRKNRDTPPAAVGDAFAESAFTALDQVGALDFTVLATHDLIEWLAILDLWPDAMPATDDPAGLGLDESDLDAAVTEQQKAQAAKVRADHQLSVHGQVVDLDASMSDLVAMVRENLDTGPASLNTPYRAADLKIMGDSAKRKGRSEGGPSTTSTVSRLSDPQKRAIGLIGEMTAFHWLQAKDRHSIVDETCWKSSNVSHVFKGLQGNDSLGFDFEVPRKGGSVMYEVKATSGDAGMIELGETEVNRAQEFVRGSQANRWRLLIVEDALSAQPRVLMLPNPFTRDNRAKFRFVGNSVRLRFKL